MPASCGDVLTNALFYSLSTIAQTLGGALGLLGAFLVFFLQDLDRRLYGVLDKVEQVYLKDYAGRSLAGLLATADYAGAIQLARGSTLSTPTFLGLLEQADALLARRRTVLDATKSAVYVGMAVIFAALLGLCLTPQLCHSGAWSSAALGLAAVAFLIALWQIKDVVAVAWSAPPPQGQ